MRRAITEGAGVRPCETLWPVTSNQSLDAAYDLHAVPVPQSAEAPIHPLEASYHALSAEFDRETYGHFDFSQSLASFHANGVPTEFSRIRRWVAIPAGADPEKDPTAGGTALFIAPLSENRSTATVFCYVHPEHRGRGLGRRLLETLRAAAEQEGRTTIQVWHTTPGGQESGPEIPAKSGVGGVPAGTPGVRLLQALGFELEQVEAQSMLEIPPASSRDAFNQQIATWRENAEAAAGPDYRTESWIGAVPAHLRAEMARLRQGMSVDVPSAGLDLEEELWTEERVRLTDEQSLSAGFEIAYTVAIHAPTGALAAYTMIEWPLDRPEGVWQGDTYVGREHRGHRLGMLVKAANLRLLLAHNPDAARLHTWNAGENEHMLAINTEMGFVPRSVEGAWEKRFA